MNPPDKFALVKGQGFSQCIACMQWRKTNIFHHEGRDWNLCIDDYGDYWENTDELSSDYLRYKRS